MAEEIEDADPTPEDDPGSPHSEATRTGPENDAPEIELDLAEIAAHAAETLPPRPAAPAEAAASEPHDLPPPIFPPAPEHKTATLRETRGPYRAGLTVTTDPARPSDPKGRSPIFVDAGRFATWESMGAFAAADEKKAPKHGKPTPGKADL